MHNEPMAYRRKRTASNHCLQEPFAGDNSGRAPKVQAEDWRVMLGTLTVCPSALWSSAPEHQV